MFLIFVFDFCFLKEKFSCLMFQVSCLILASNSRGPFGQFRRNIKALGGPKYKARGIETLLAQYFDDDKHLDSMLTSVIIPSFDIKIQQPVFFSSWKVCGQPPLYVFPF
jgi:patatin-like phospholipase/acyl hydrolase